MRSRALRFHLGVHDKRQDLRASAGAVALRTRDLLRFFALSITLTQPRMLWISFDLLSTPTCRPRRIEVRST